MFGMGRIGGGVGERTARVFTNTEVLTRLGPVLLIKTAGDISFQDQASATNAGETII